MANELQNVPTELGDTQTIGITQQHLDDMIDNMEQEGQSSESVDPAKVLKAAWTTIHDLILG